MPHAPLNRGTIFAAVAAALVLSAASLPARADYVAGLNPNGDNFLSLRRGPGTGFREILRMDPNTVLQVLERRGEWRRVRLEDGTEGWAFGRYIRPGYPRGYTPPDNGNASADAGGEDDNGDAPPVKPKPTKPSSGGDSDSAALEKLRLEAEIERLRLEQEKLKQGSGQSATTTQPTTGGTATTPAGRRVALVIGNSDYRKLNPLSTPANDAQVLAERLSQLGYEVLLGKNQSRTEMAELLAQFYAQSEGAGVALFYFSGHGMQIEGRNYLLPTDAQFENKSAFLDVDARAIDLQKFIGATSSAKIGVAFVDACRDNPVVEKSIAANIKGSSTTKGLAVVSRENLNSGQFVGFAAEPGKTAETGTGDVSVYTTALLKGLGEKGLDVSIMHRRIRSEVEAATNGRQSPRYVDDLQDAFTLNPAQ